MNNQNISKIYLLDVPLENDLKNTLYFSSASAQKTYFDSKVVKSYTDFTYQRKDQIIRIPDVIDNIYNCNYVMYQNTGYSNKWFYAFIDKMEYISDGRTDVHIKTDVIQTYLFDYTVQPSFVEREHVSNDTIGLHTIPEGLETGEYIIADKTSLYTAGNSTYICVSTSELPSDMSINTNTRQYNGIYSGTSYILFDTPLSASNFIRAMDGLGKGDAIQAVFLVPTNLCTGVTFTLYSVSVPGLSGQTIQFQAGVPPYTTTYADLTAFTNITHPQSIDGYHPHNNKLWCYPYSFMYVTNNVGSDVEFRYEDFIDNAASFKVIGSITPGCSIKCFPTNYKKYADTASSMNSYNYGISGAKYPICSWSSDVYTNWLTQNGLNLGFVQLNAEEAGYVKGAANLGLGVGSALAGNIYGIVNIGAGVGDILGTMQESYRHKMTPDQAKGNTNSGDITFSSNNLDMPLYKMNVRSEMAKVIDQFFDMYGYKVNTVKTPNVNHRANWWYTKTMNVNITGSIPNEDMDLIRACYNNGITFWKDPTKIYDYTQSNGIAS